jgi:ADP-ribose pyrophosphatase
MLSENQKWESLAKESILERKPWFEVFREEVRLPDGKIVPEYYEIEMPHYTAVFAVTVEQRIMVLRCYRHAIGEVTLTMPGGMIEKGESPLEGIKREFLEETGYKAKEWKSLGTFIGNSTRGCGTYHFFSQTKLIKRKRLTQGIWRKWSYYYGHQKRLNRRWLKGRFIV